MTEKSMPTTSGRVPWRDVHTVANSSSVSTTPGAFKAVGNG